MKIKIQGLNHIQICIPENSEEVARKFYSDILQLTEISKPEILSTNGGIWYKLADIQLHISTEKKLVKSKRHFAVEIENMEETCRYLVEQNIEIIDTIQIPGFKRCFIHDPFDNRIELMQRCV